MTGQEAILRAYALRPIIEQAAQSLDDQTALKAVELYPHWTAGLEYINGTKVQHGGKLWRVLQDHISQEYWTPDVVPSLFEHIDETHTGTLDDPIPYDGNMVLFEGLYYSQNGVVYLCTRDSGTPLYHALDTLIGLYVEEVK